MVDIQTMSVICGSAGMDDRIRYNKSL